MKMVGETGFEPATFETVEITNLFSNNNHLLAA